jgi:hypothetical protein
VKHKATLPLLLLLLVVGQMSAEFCMAQCEGMSTGMMAHACGMHGMAQGHCALCKHTSDKRVSNPLSAHETCSGQACKIVLGLVQNRSDLGFGSLVSPISMNIFAPPIQNGTRAAQFRDVRSTTSILPFDPLMSALRI